MTKARTTKLGRKRRTPSKPAPTTIERKAPLGLRTKKVAAKKDGGKVEGEQSAPRSDRRPRGKIPKRADGGNVDDEHFTPLAGGHDRTPAQSALRALVRGASEVAGAPGDAGHILGVGSQYALSKGAERLGLISPERGAQMRENAWNQQPLSGASSINDRILNTLKQVGVSTEPDE